MIFVGLGRGCSLETVEPGECAFVTLHRNLYNVGQRARPQEHLLLRCPKNSALF